jgi:FkbH-like protein
MNSLYWLPKHADASSALRRLKTEGGAPNEQLSALRAIAKHDLDFVQTANADRRLTEIRRQLGSETAGLSPMKLAILASSTVDHLLPSIRIAALRRGVLIDCYVAPYNQYRQELLNSASGLYAFQPDAVLLAIDEHEARIPLPLSSTWEEVDLAVSARLEEWARFWNMVTGTLGAVMIQQTIVEPPLSTFGHFDSHVAGSPAHILAHMNHVLRRRARDAHVLVFDAERLASHVGKNTWCDFPLWHHAKQMVSPAYSPLYGDSLARLLACIRGRSAKCLVLDLDNTLWGGVIGDDGLAGIEIGQGTGRGEAYSAFQHYIKHLRERGVILAVCSKNEEIHALQPFQEHPEMLLHVDDFAVLVANWENKAANLESIARQLNIGLDALVFFDDNPAERTLVRQFLPEVWVPEVPGDPALYAACLSDAGFFEAAAFTADDLQRTAQYRANAQRAQLQSNGHDLESFLRGLNMEMEVAPFDTIGLTRIAQLINKSNQFNLRTQRYTEAQVRQMMEDPSLITLQIRLKDSCGDNGMISVLIGRPMLDDPTSLFIDTWLMSCRVLGRQVEREALNQIADQAQVRGFHRLIGEYIHSEKNHLVQDHYRSLGFSPLIKHADREEGRSFWQLDLAAFKPLSTTIQVQWKGTVTL